MLPLDGKENQPRRINYVEQSPGDGWAWSMGKTRLERMKGGQREPPSDVKHDILHVQPIHFPCETGKVSRWKRKRRMRGGAAHG